MQDTGGAALDYKAQVVEMLLALTLKATRDLHKINSKTLITFESPRHGSFKSNAQVQAMLRIEGFWLVEMDYCADETLDGAVHGPIMDGQSTGWGGAKEGHSCTGVGPRR